MIEINDISYELNDDDCTAVVTSSPKATGDILIPTFVLNNNSQYFVTKILSFSFSWAKINSISFPSDSHVYEFEPYFLSNSSIRKLTIPPKVTSLNEFWNFGAEYLATVDTSLNPNFIVEDGILFNKEKNVIYYVFKDIHKIVIPNSVKTIKARACYRGCLKELSFENTEFSNLEEIEKDAFSFCFLKRVDLPKSLKKIGQGAFSGNSTLEVVNADQNLTEIGETAFKDCNLVNMNLKSEKIGTKCFEGNSSISISVSSKDTNSIQSLNNEELENNIIRNPKKKEFQQPSLETKVKNLYLSLEAKIKENELLKEEIVVLKKLKEESDSNNLIYKNEIEKVTKLNLDLHNQNKEFEKLLENQKLINEKLMAEKSSNEKNPNQNLINKESLENENNKNKNNSNICSDKTQNHVTNEEFEKMKNELAALTSKVKEFSNVNCQLSKDNKMLQSIVKNLKIEIETDKKVRENENLIHSKEFENLKAKNLSNENRMKNLLNENEKLKKLISVYEKKISLSEHEISLLNLPNKREKTQKKKIVIDELLKEIP